MRNVEAPLRAAAFGADPDLADRTLAGAELGSPRLRWLAAVLLGARGRYARATAVLNGLAADADPVLAALADSTLASHRRQLGGHADARRWDARAMARIASASRVPRADANDPDGVDLAGALADALLGLAADALALGRQAEARMLLARFDDGIVAGMPVSTAWRAGVRHGWVCAEVELAAGNPGAAREPAERAAGLARSRGAVRHIVKSDIVLAAALAGSGGSEERGRAAGLVTRAAASARRYGFASLVWPAELIAADLDLARAQDYRSSAGAVLHGVLQHSDPAGRRLAALSPWVPVP